MKTGYVKNGREVLCWIPEGETRDSFAWSTNPKGVKLAEFSLFSGSTALAYYCRSCGKVIIDVKY